MVVDVSPYQELNAWFHYITVHTLKTMLEVFAISVFVKILHEYSYIVEFIKHAGEKR